MATPNNNNSSKESDNKIEVDATVLTDSWNNWWQDIKKDAAPKLQNETFYVTTAINYTNGQPHIGHAYEAITTDIIARYNRIFGRDTFFLTGTDEHGQKIAQAAEAKKITPLEVSTHYATLFQQLNARLLISNDEFIRTTCEKHIKTAQSILTRAKEAGDIYLGKYEGYYSVREEKFITESEAKKLNYLDPSNGKPLQKVEEESFFFKMSKYHNQLLEHINKNPEFIQPTARRDEILKRLEDELQDLSISRVTFDWGIKIPGSDKHVMYVWFDALTNYLSGIDYPDGDNARYWPANLQVVGKDITWFHCVIWPTMLMSAGIPLPKTVFGHGFINDKNGHKMSKSIGNVVDPNELLAKYDADTVRLYLIHDTTFGEDMRFNEDILIDIHNADLADSIGNLVNRALNLCKKYCNLKIPAEQPEQNVLKLWKDSDNVSIADRTEKLMSEYAITPAFKEAIKMISDINQYLTEQAPWKIKDADDENFAKRKSIIRAVLEAIYVAAHFLAPTLPTTCYRIFRQLNAKPTAITLLKDNFENLEVGSTVCARFQFKKIVTANQKAEKAKKMAEQKKQKNAKKNNDKKKAQQNQVAQPLFSQLDIRVGQIKKVWKHEASDKLYCEEIDIGNDTVLPIASGLQKFYSLEDMQHARVLVLCNLKPSKLAGFLSKGMVLCANAADASKVEFITPPENAKLGERVSLAGQFEQDPISAAQIKKRKVVEKVKAEFKTDDNKFATFQGHFLQTSNGDKCFSATLTNAFIS